MTASTFIFVHDQQIVLDYIAAGKFHDLPDVKYCFLGMRPTDRIEDLPNVIIARNLPDNIEHYPNLVAWTGWYALVRNGLIKTDIVNLFEYDVNVVGDWVQPTESTNYFPYPSTDENWWNYNGIRSEVAKCVTDFYEAKHLPMTSNYTLDQIGLASVMESMEFSIHSKKLNPLHPQAGHIIERIFSFWLEGEIPIYPNRLTHLYADSHGTQGRNAGYEQLKSKLL
jgi:hypothetical protein